MSCRFPSGGLVRRSLLLLLPLLLPACGSLDSKRVDYKSAQRNKPLDVPPELSVPGKDDRYAVSELGSKGTTYSDYLASRSGKKSLATGEPAAPLLPQFEKIRVERAGTQRWLVLPESPEKVWPMLRQFVESLGLKVVLESVDTGILETGWAERKLGVTDSQSGLRAALSRALGNVYDTGERDKFRLRLEPGLQAGTTEVFVSYRAAEEVFITPDRSDTRWQSRPPDPEREAEMLLRLATFVGLGEKKGQELLAAPAADSGRVRLVEQDGALHLEVDERFDRAWRRIGLVLDRNGFTVDDRDRRSGEYFVKYSDPVADKKKADSSFWSSLAFWRDEEKLEAVDSTFRVLVKDAGGETSRVSILSKDGAPLNTPAVKRVLELMKKELT